MCISSHMKAAFGVANTSCPQPRILFLDRKSRRAANTEQLVDAIRQLGLNNTLIEVVRFEGWSFLEQMVKVSILNTLAEIVTPKSIEFIKPMMCMYM